MEYSTSFKRMEASEDSGCISQSTIETTASLHENSSGYASYVDSMYTPIAANAASRKRKVSQLGPKMSGLDYKHAETPGNASYTSPWAFEANILSSTLNESLTQNFENCVLNSTPNFYVERSEFQEKSSAFSVNTSIEPSTPIKFHGTNAKIDYLKTSSNIKLGSPERNSILYPEIKRFEPAYKPKTPQKLFEKTKRFSPAKKRLFSSDRRLAKVDPMSFFLNDKRSYVGIVSTILAYLPDTDLCAFKMVSRKWRNALMNDKCSCTRYNLFVRIKRFNKENWYNAANVADLNMSCEGTTTKTPVSPRKRNSNDFFETAKILREGQNLNKCPRCQHAAIVEMNISQCQRDVCGYIHCVKCSSFSMTGPENFVDSCQMSALIVDKPKYRPRLTDSPPSKMDITDELPSFLLDESFNSSLGKCDSPGSLSDSSLYHYYRKSPLGEKVGILQDCNRNLGHPRHSMERRSSLAAVVPLRNTKIQELMEPSSPPKIKNVVCSKQSKNRLKRLLR